MARRGENIRKRSDGRWEGRYLIHINGSKKYRSVYAPSYNEVKQKLFNSKKESEITLLSQKEQTAPLNASADMSLDEIGQLWLIYIKNNRKYSTYRKYANIYDMHIRDIFGSLIADEISLEIIEKALPKEMSASLYKSIYCVLNQILSYGNRYCGTPKIHLKTEKLRTVPKPVQTINATDQQKLCRYLLSDLDSCKLGILICLYMGLRLGDDDDKIRLNQRKPSKYKGLRRFGPEKNLQRINKFMKERPIFYKNLIQMKENIRFYLRCFYCITKVMILQFNSENRTELARNG